ncbi:hypothetical protein HUJ04_000217 [Dendroctonus ponderosae]|nr:hypothetical protein HUJ04_000217 [Dendroctonus ponderosae]
MPPTRRIVKVLRNGAPDGPRIVALPESPDDCQQLLQSLWGCAPLRMFLEDGSALTDCDCLRDGDTVYVSSGEGFAPRCSPDEWVTLNVGGTSFSTTRKTLTMAEPHSMLARMFSQESEFQPSRRDRNGAWLIDRSPQYFAPLLHYLRCGQLVLDGGVSPEGVLGEARFFGLDSLIPTLEQMLLETRECRDEAPLTRRDVVDALIRSSNSEVLRFQGVNLAGADLSKLDLRAINFKYANMQRCNLAAANLSWCCLERADLSHAVLDNAQLSGVKGLRAVMEGASMRNCNFTDPVGGANLEGVNLKGACLEDSDLGDANLRIANCRNANLKNCNLRSAVLAGADLEKCDLSGSDLFEANLRGANLKDAVLELMQTPLHMSQTIR